ncbi:MAG: RICIN domain-containing protein [Spirochaetales bacterium]|jgi:hypothetical protein|nr:RICIN domain-containing protein [Spirochaetales bacterium]
MKLRHLTILILLFSGLLTSPLLAQNLTQTDEVESTSDNMQAFPFTDSTVSYNLSDSGEYKPIIWGLDLAWLDQVNIIRGIAFMGKERIDVVRSSFMPTNSLVGDTALQGDALINTRKRINIINTFLDPTTNVVLNSDHPSVDPYFYGNPSHWAALIDVTTRMHQEAGREVVTVSPFNEPDYSQTGQGTIQDFYNIIFELKKIPRFDSICISGGNTLNNDQALFWYNFLNSAGLDEGNTHQLAGSFDTYANFFQEVRANGDHATNDELHNVMEAMVGVEYGLQTGIWWGTAEYARGEFVKASDGKRLGYAEHRDNWTAASVYRAPDGKVQAFLGGSERQGVTTTFRFLSEDCDVYYDGHGPQREYIMELPTGDPNTYQTAKHTNAEKVINITWGDDIQPVINGKYILVNRHSGKVLEAANGSSANGTNIQQNSYNGATYHQWNVEPINPRNGGDFSYFTISGVHGGKHLDITNASLDNGGNAILWEKGTWWDGRQSLNQVWYLEYVEDGWFFIRNQFSAKCLDVQNASTASGTNIILGEKDGSENQQWRFIPVGAGVEFDAPSPPTNLLATANAESVRLDWTASPEEDVAGYTIFRSESAGGPYNTIARDVKSTAFVDNTRTETGQYFYVVKAVDKSLNSSAYSEEVEAATTGDHDLVAHFRFNENTLDSSINLNHGATLGAITYVEGKADNFAIDLNGEDAFIQLPATVANQEEITVATWVYWNGGTPWQRIFEFGNNETEYMNLTPGMRFSVKNGGAEQRLNASALPEGEWAHVAVTLGASGARMYLNGELVDESAAIDTRPIDFKPILNYIGRAIFQVPMFDGRMDDFRIYNYELSGEEIFALYEDVQTDAASVKVNRETRFSVYPVPANNVLKFNYDSDNQPSAANIGLYNVFGRLVLHHEIRNGQEEEINVSAIPAGIYMLKFTKGQEFVSKKVIVNH